MEQKKISKIAELEIKNANLVLQVLQMQANQIMAQRDRILLAEFKRLKCKPEEWRLDTESWEIIKKEEK